MGFDVCGYSPKSRRGEYFRNTEDWWKPLWCYIAEICEDILTEEEIRSGHYSFELSMPEEKALIIAERLSEALSSGAVKEFENWFFTEFKSKPQTTCGRCDGHGKRYYIESNEPPSPFCAPIDPRPRLIRKYVDLDDYPGAIQEQCGLCNGSGKETRSNDYWQFSVKNVRIFCDFCGDSGGFVVA